MRESEERATGLGQLFVRLSFGHPASQAGPSFKTAWQRTCSSPFLEWLGYERRLREGVARLRECGFVGHRWRRRRRDAEEAQQDNEDRKARTRNAPLSSDAWRASC